jgi:hypothetical protein
MYIPQGKLISHRQYAEYRGSHKSEYRREKKSRILEDINNP